jgi:hypothetical protein
MFRMLQAIPFLMLSLAPPACAESSCPDLALVLAIDSSSSIDDAEYALQIQGYAFAFRNPAVLRALNDAGRVDVAVVLWAGPEMPNHVVPWMTISSPGDALRLAEWFASLGRHVKGETDIGNGLTSALDLIERKACGLRRIVNVSGDGRASTWSNRGPARTTLKVAKERAEKMGVTVNGLAITNVEPFLTEYYRTALITGPGCFVMEVDSFDDFSLAIIEKLRREIEPQLSASLRSPSR